MCRPRFRNPEPDAPDLRGAFFDRVALEFRLDAFRGDHQTLMTVLDDDAANELLHLALTSTDPVVSTFATNMLTRSSENYAEEEMARQWRHAA